MKARTLILALAAAGVIPLLASVASAIETRAPQPLHSGPRIIQVPEPPPPAEPKRQASEPEKKPAPVKPPLSERPAAPSPSARTPKSNRKIWI